MKKRMSRNGRWASAMSIISVCLRFRPPNLRNIDPRTSPDGSWWPPGAICRATRASRGVVGAAWEAPGGSAGLMWRLKDAQLHLWREKWPRSESLANIDVIGGPAECASPLSGDFSLLNKAIRLLRQHLTRLRARRGRAVFHRFAHSAGPGMVPQRVEAVGSGFDGLMQSSK